MKNCSDCGGCTSCGSCGGCGRSLALTEPELRLLRLFSQLPFLPAARKASDEVPVFLEEGDPAENSAALACLEKKGLIDIDYHCPLKGFDYTPWPRHLHGSAALTARGQEVLDTLSIQGAQPE